MVVEEAAGLVVTDPDGNRFLDFAAGIAVCNLLDPKLVDSVLVGAFTRGLLLLGCGDSAVRLTPPLVVTMEQADTAIEILDEVLAAL